jgi:hypothetical protein
MLLAAAAAAALPIVRWIRSPVWAPGHPALCLRCTAVLRPCPSHALWHPALRRPQPSGTRRPTAPQPLLGPHSATTPPPRHLTVTQSHQPPGAPPPPASTSTPCPAASTCCAHLPSCAPLLHPFLCAAKLHLSLPPSPVLGVLLHFHISPFSHFLMPPFPYYIIPPFPHPAISPHLSLESLSIRSIRPLGGISTRE